MNIEKFSKPAKHWGAMKSPTFFIALLLLLMNAGFTTKPSSVAHIAGHITDLYGSPLSGAVIEVSKTELKNLSVVTNKDGRYVIDNAPEGVVTVTAGAQGFRPETRSLTLRPGETVLFDIGLEPATIDDQASVQLTGTIKTQGKAPLGDVSVTALSPFNDRLLKTVKTDSAGRYRVEFDNGGQFIAYASRSGFLAASFTVVVPAAPPRQAELNFVLVPITESIYDKAP